VSESELTPWLVRYAYLQGAFPMGNEDGSIDWYQPHRRALFPIEGVHVSRSLARTIRKGTFEVRFDTAFEAVMRHCLRPEANWITEEIIRVYTDIHGQGWGPLLRVLAGRPASGRRLRHRSWRVLLRRVHVPPEDRRL
jgi:leucyl/phenylalanyl-tRNA--protein transferase